MGFRFRCTANFILNLSSVLFVELHFPLEYDFGKCKKKRKKNDKYQQILPEYCKKKILYVVYIKQRMVF